MRLKLLAAAVLLALLALACNTRSEGAATGRIRAVSFDPPRLILEAADFALQVERACSAGVNTVGLSAGRLDWNYFRWPGHEEYRSNALTGNARDLLAEAAAAFDSCAGIGHISAIIDVFAPRWLQLHPEAAAYSAGGERIDYQVSTVQLAEGAFGKELLQMIDFIARSYPVQSISLTELFYYEEGYGPDDLASYRKFSGQADWPRLPSGRIDIDAPSVGTWRSVLISGFVAQAAAVVHAYGKELLVDVRVPWGDLQDRGRKQGQDYRLLLDHADRLVLWVYLGLTDRPASYIRDIAQAYRNYGSDRIILSFGLWGRDSTVLSAAELEASLQQAQRSPLASTWITPASLLDDQHWGVLEHVWQQ